MNGTTNGTANISPLTLRIQTTKSASLVYLNFNRKILNYTSNNKILNLTELLIIQLEQLIANEYNYNLELIDYKTIRLKFDFYVSFNPISLTVTIDSPNDFRDANNVSLISHNRLIQELNITGKLPMYLKTSLEFQNKIENMRDTTEIASYSTLLLSTIPFFWLSIIQFLWVLLDSMQITNFFLYINVCLPENAQTILFLFADANLYFISNFLNKVLGVSFNSQNFDENVIPLIRAPEKFDNLMISSLFLLNAGALIILNILLYASYGILLCMLKLSKKNQNSFFQNFLEKISKFYNYPLIIRLQSILFLGFSLATCLQFRSFTTLNTMYFYNYVIAFCSGIYLIVFLFAIFKLSNNELSYFHDEDYLKYYSPIFTDSNMDIFFGRNYFFMSCLKKLVLSIIVVFIYDFPYLEISLLILVQTVDLFLSFKYELTNLKSMNYFIRFSETQIMLGYFMVLLIQVYFDCIIQKEIKISSNKVDNFLLMGWILIAIILSVLAFYFIIFCWNLIVLMMKLHKKLKLISLKTEIKEFKYLGNSNEQDDTISLSKKGNFSNASSRNENDVSNTSVKNLKII